MTGSKTPRREKELLASPVAQGNNLAAEYSVQYSEKKELDTKDGGQNATFPDKNVDSAARPAIVSAEDSHTLRGKTAGEPCSETFSIVKSSSTTEDKDSMSRPLRSGSENVVKDSSSESSNGSSAGPQLEPVISSSEPLKDGSRTGEKSVSTESLEVDRSTGAHSDNNTENSSLVSKFKNLVKRFF
jgi:hypothetical protein